MSKNTRSLLDLLADLGRAILEDQLLEAIPEEHRLIVAGFFTALAYGIPLLHKHRKLGQGANDPDELDEPDER